MRSFTDLIEEAEAADVSGWGFGWLEGRASEERPPWGFTHMLARRLPQAESALDLDTGGGEIIAEMPRLPSRMTVTEGWLPNVEIARRVLTPRGVEVVIAVPGESLPFADCTFDLVTSRHPVQPNWHEIHRVLTDRGVYFAQHVGPSSAFELIERFLGPRPAAGQARDPDAEIAAAQTAGLEAIDVQTARCRMQFDDIGAIVWILRKCVWWVPDFTVARYRETLQQLDAELRQTGPFVAHSSRTLVIAERRPR